MSDRYIAVRCKLCDDLVILEPPYKYEDFLAHLRKHDSALEEVEEHE